MKLDIKDYKRIKELAHIKFLDNAISKDSPPEMFVTICIAQATIDYLISKGFIKDPLSKN